MKKIALAISILVVVLSFGLVATPAYAEDCDISFGGGTSCASGGGQSRRPLFSTDKWCVNGTTAVDAPDGSGACKAGSLGHADGIVTSVVSVMMYIIGIISVVMLIYGGILYSISAGDEKKILTAKHTIIYAIVGAVFAIIAWTLVNFVLGVLTGV